MSNHLEMRKLLESKRDEMERRVKARGKSGDLNAESHADQVDEAAYLEETYKSATLSTADANTLLHVASAIERMNSGEYGICPDCEEEIPLKRLNAVPWALRCVPCQDVADAEAEVRDGHSRPMKRDWKIAADERKNGWKDDVHYKSVIAKPDRMAAIRLQATSVGKQQLNLVPGRFSR